MSQNEPRQMLITVSQDTERSPQTAEEAIRILNNGNAAFAALGDGSGVHKIVLSPEAIGLPRDAGSVMNHEPFVAALGCSDARVPLELAFGCSGNEIFITRVAGNIPGSDVVGSMHYAMSNLPSIKTVVVLGHTHCGAVTSAVDTMLNPETYLGVARDPQLRGIVDSLLAAVNLASVSIAEVYGADIVESEHYRDALVEVATFANAAITATVLNNDLNRDVTFAIYDIQSRSVGVLTESGWLPGLQHAPADDTELAQLLLGVARAGILSH